MRGMTEMVTLRNVTIQLCCSVVLLVCECCTVLFRGGAEDVNVNCPVPHLRP